MPDFVSYFDERKFMWDGAEYETRARADEAKQGYEKDAFETRIVENAGKFFVYTRRLAEQQTAAAD